MTTDERAVVVQMTVRAFTSSFPPGDIQDAFSLAADVAVSLIATVAATGGIELSGASRDFLRAIERRCDRFNDQSFNVGLAKQIEQ